MNTETSAFRLTLYLSTTICYAGNIPVTRDSEINHKGANIHGAETREACIKCELREPQLEQLKGGFRSKSIFASSPSRHAWRCYLELTAPSSE